MDIVSLGWTTHGVAIAVQFEGDIFEMEDQRNWTDASFKTYSTPLAMPFPVELSAGTHVSQSLVICAERVSEDDAATGEGVTIELERIAAAVPSIGVLASTRPGAIAPRTMPADFVMVELDTRQNNWVDVLDRAAIEAGELPLDVRIVTDDPPQIDTVIAAAASLQLVRLGVFSPSSQTTTEPAWEALKAAVTRHGLAVEIVGGGRSHFTELNRRHGLLPAGLSSLTFSSTPQMHAVERAQVIESVSVQRITAEQAVAIAGDRPVHVGPVTLRARYNSVATTDPPRDPDDVTEGYGAEFVAFATDPRQTSSALAAWTIASAAAFAVPGVATITWFEASGPRGIVDAAGAPYPVAAAITALHELGGRPLWRAEPADGVWAIGATLDGRVVILVASLVASAVTVDIVVGDQTSAIELKPFGWTRLEFRVSRLSSLSLRRPRPLTACSMVFRGLRKYGYVASCPFRQRSTGRKPSSRSAFAVRRSGVPCELRPYLDPRKVTADEVSS